MAHYDTKSQLVPTGIRVLLVSSVALLCAALCIIAVLVGLGAIALPATALRWIAAIVLAEVCLLIGNVTGNRSPGAIDNGSAVGTLLELAQSWRPRVGDPLEVFWVASGSEEVELDGARHFLAQRESWWHEKPTLLINLESVGAGTRTLLAGESRAVDLARGAADALGITHGGLNVLGAGMDHEPFAARGLCAVSILGDVVRASLALHSPRDNMRLIDRNALDRAGRLAARLAWKWAEIHEKEGKTKTTGAG
jgi:Zn-dependent M28 family amino/carboxypeptidase